MAPPKWSVRGATQQERKAVADSLDDTRTWVDGRGYRLSDRLWSSKDADRKAIDNVLRKALATGTSPLGVERALRQYLTPYGAQAQTRRPVGAKFDKASQTWVDSLSHKGNYAARRLARTELSRAYGATTLDLAMRNPWTTGVKWNLTGRHAEVDECDQNATQNRDGLGPGIYKPEHFPRYPNHPNCLCYITKKATELSDILEMARKEAAASQLGGQDGASSGNATSGGRSSGNRSLLNLVSDSLRPADLAWQAEMTREDAAVWASTGPHPDPLYIGYSKGLYESFDPQWGIKAPDLLSLFRNKSATDGVRNKGSRNGSEVFFKPNGIAKIDVTELLPQGDTVEDLTPHDIRTMIRKYTIQAHQDNVFSSDPRWKAPDRPRSADLDRLLNGLGFDDTNPMSVSSLAGQFAVRHDVGMNRLFMALKVDAIELVDASGASQIVLHPNADPNVVLVNDDAPDAISESVKERKRAEAPQVKWQPAMTEQDAAWFAAHGAYPERTFFHYTSDVAGTKIKESGFRASFGMLGVATYMTSSDQQDTLYLGGSATDNPNPLRVRTNITKPFVLYSDSSDQRAGNSAIHEQIVAAYPEVQDKVDRYWPGGATLQFYTNELKDRGHDGLLVYPGGRAEYSPWLLVYDSENLTVVDNTAPAAQVEFDDSLQEGDESLAFAKPMPEQVTEVPWDTVMNKSDAEAFAMEGSYARDTVFWVAGSDQVDGIRDIIDRGLPLTTSFAGHDVRARGVRGVRVVPRKAMVEIGAYPMRARAKIVNPFISDSYNYRTDGSQVQAIRRDIAARYPDFEDAKLPIEQFLSRKGHDAVVFKNGDPEYGDDIVMFEPTSVTLVGDKDKWLSWKPVVTEAEGIAFAENSPIKHVQFYHHTTEEAAPLIKDTGLNSNAGWYGTGIYATNDYTLEGAGATGARGTAATLKLAIRGDNFLRVTAPQGGTDIGAIARKAEDDGYDGLLLDFSGSSRNQRDHVWAVVFDKFSVSVVDEGNLEETKPRGEGTRTPLFPTAPAKEWRPVMPYEEALSWASETTTPTLTNFVFLTKDQLVEAARGKGIPMAAGIMGDAIYSNNIRKNRELLANADANDLIRVPVMSNATNLLDLRPPRDIYDDKFNFTVEQALSKWAIDNAPLGVSSWDMEAIQKHIRSLGYDGVMLATDRDTTVTISFNTKNLVITQDPGDVFSPVIPYIDQADPSDVNKAAPIRDFAKMTWADLPDTGYAVVSDRNSKADFTSSQAKAIPSAYNQLFYTVGDLNENPLLSYVLPGTTDRRKAYKWGMQVYVTRDEDYLSKRWAEEANRQRDLDETLPVVIKARNPLVLPITPQDTDDSLDEASLDAIRGRIAAVLEPIQKAVDESGETDAAFTIRIAQDAVKRWMDETGYDSIEVGFHNSDKKVVIPLLAQQVMEIQDQQIETQWDKITPTGPPTSAKFSDMTAAEVLEVEQLLDAEDETLAFAKPQVEAVTEEVNIVSTDANVLKLFKPEWHETDFKPTDKLAFYPRKREQALAYDAIKEAVRTVAAVHGLGSTNANKRSIKMRSVGEAERKWWESRDTALYVWGPKYGERQGVWVNGKYGDVARHSAYHEMWHAIDNKFLPKRKDLSFASNDTGKRSVLRPLMTAIEQSESYKTLMELLKSPDKSPYSKASGYKQDTQYLTYLTQNIELTARAYEQYMALKTRDKNDDYDRLSKAPGRPGLPPQYWSHDDFAPIAREFDALFQKLGWAKAQSAGAATTTKAAETPTTVAAETPTTVVAPPADTPVAQPVAPPPVKKPKEKVVTQAVAAPEIVSVGPTQRTYWFRTSTSGAKTFDEQTSQNLPANGYNVDVGGGKRIGWNTREAFGLKLAAVVPQRPADTGRQFDEERRSVKVAFDKVLQVPQGTGKQEIVLTTLKSVYRKQKLGDIPKLPSGGDDAVEMMRRLGIDAIVLGNINDPDHTLLLSAEAENYSSEAANETIAFAKPSKQLSPTVLNDAQEALAFTAGSSYKNVMYANVDRATWDRLVEGKPSDVFTGPLPFEDKGWFSTTAGHGSTLTQNKVFVNAKNPFVIETLTPSDNDPLSPGVGAGVVLWDSLTYAYPKLMEPYVAQKEKEEAARKKNDTRTKKAQTFAWFREQPGASTTDHAIMRKVLEKAGHDGLAVEFDNGAQLLFPFSGDQVRTAPYLEATNWKPVLTTEEAQEFTKDSVVKDMQFYHHTSDAGEQGIMISGLNPNPGWFGTGIYATTGASLKEAQATGAQGMTKTLKLAVNVKNLKRLYAPQSRTMMSDEMTRKYKEQGYDGILLDFSLTSRNMADQQWIVVFDKENVSVVRDAESNKIAQFPTRQPINPLPEGVPFAPVMNRTDAMGFMAVNAPDMPSGGVSYIWATEEQIRAHAATDQADMATSPFYTDGIFGKAVYSLSDGNLNPDDRRIGQPKNVSRMLRVPVVTPLYNPIDLRTFNASNRIANTIGEIELLLIDYYETNPLGNKPRSARGMSTVQIIEALKKEGFDGIIAPQGREASMVIAFPEAGGVAVTYDPTVAAAPTIATAFEPAPFAEVADKEAAKAKFAKASWRTTDFSLLTVTQNGVATKDGDPAMSLDQLAQLPTARRVVYSVPGAEDSQALLAGHGEDGSRLLGAADGNRGAGWNKRFAFISARALHEHNPEEHSEMDMTAVAVVENPLVIDVTNQEYLHNYSGATDPEAIRAALVNALGKDVASALFTETDAYYFPDSVKRASADKLLEWSNATGYDAIELKFNGANPESTKSVLIPVSNRQVLQIGDAEKRSKAAFQEAANLNAKAESALAGVQAEGNVIRTITPTNMTFSRLRVSAGADADGYTHISVAEAALIPSVRKQVYYVRGRDWNDAKFAGQAAQDFGTVRGGARMLTDTTTQSLPGADTAIVSIEKPLAVKVPSASGKAAAMNPDAIEAYANAIQSAGVSTQDALTLWEAVFDDNILGRHGVIAQFVKDTGYDSIEFEFADGVKRLVVLDATKQVMRFDESYGLTIDDYNNVVQNGVEAVPEKPSRYIDTNISDLLKTLTSDTDAADAKAKEQATPVVETAEGPAGTPVSTAFKATMPANPSPFHSAVQDALTAATSVIDSVHGDGPLPNIAVQKMRSGGLLEAELVINNGSIKHVTVNAEAKNANGDISLADSLDMQFAVLHEIGHVIDLAGLGSDGKFATSRPSAELQDVMSAISETDSYKALAKMQTQQSKSVVYNGQQMRYKIDQKYVKYAMSDRELFARAYTQYVISKLPAGHPLKAKLQDNITLGQGLYPTHWEDADFAPIQEAMDRLMKAQGWRT